MRNRVLLFVATCLYYSGLISISNRLHRYSGRRLLIVNYHLASEGELRRHLLYLHKHFRLQFLDQALEALYTTDKDKAIHKDRRLPLAITFDDGYVDNYTHAYALACELQIPITIFLIASYIGSGSAFWWFDHLLEKSQVDSVSIDGHTYRPNTPNEQRELAQFIDTQVSAKANKDARQTYLHWLSNALCLPTTDVDLNKVPTPMLNWEQVQEMQASGWVSFGGHTLHHSTLARMTNEKEAYKEVADCRLLLQEKLGQASDVFAYPHGGIEHIGADGVLTVQRANYRWAVTTIPGANTPATNPYLLKRMSANVRMHWLLIALMTSGIWDFLSYLNSLIKRNKYRKILKMM